MGAGHPVNVVDGYKHASAIDFQSVSNPELKLTRYKNPLWKGVGVLGQGWVTNLDMKIAFTNASQTCYPAPGKASCNIQNPTMISFYTEEGGIVQMEKSGVHWAGRETAAQYRVTKISDGSSDNGKYQMTVRGGSAYSPRMVFKTNGFVDYVDQRDGNRLTYTYDTSNRLTRVTHTSGRTIQLGWTSATPGTATTITAPNGGIYRFGYYTVGTAYASGVNAPFLRSIEYPDGRGDVEYIHETGTSTVTGSPQPYTNVHRILQIRVNNTPVTNYTYKYAGNNSSAVATTAHADGTNLVRYNYNMSGGTREVINPYGKKTTYRVEDGKITETIGAASPNCAASFKLASYLENGLLEYATDENDVITRYEYDSFGRRTKAFEAAGTPEQRTTIWEYDSDPANILRTELVKSITVVGLRKTTYAYTPSFGTFPNGPSLLASATFRNLTAVGTANQDRTVQYRYTFHGNGMIATATEDGPVSGTSDRKVLTYNTKGDLISIQNGLGHTRTFSGHNGFGQPARVVNENGDATEYEYDLRGRIVIERRFFNAVPSEARYVYDAFGRLDSVVKPYGQSMVYRYDSVGRVTGRYERLPNGKYEFESYDYNGASDVVATYRGEIASIPGPSNPMPVDPTPPTPEPPGPPEPCLPGRPCLDPLGRGLAEATPTGAPSGSTVTFRSRVEYDELGRVRFLRGNNGQYTHFVYDATGNIASTKNALGETTTFTYDPLNRISTTKDPNSGVTSFAYNVADQITRVTDPRNLATTYQYDGFGQLWRLTSPDTGITANTFDYAGRLTRVVKANSKQVDHTYDALGRVLKSVAGGQAQIFTYDTCTNGKGRVCRIDDPSGVLTYTYTPEGLPLTQGQIIGSSSIAFGQAYTYDNFGRLTGISYPGGVSVGYGYSAGKLGAITAKTGSTTHNVTTGIQYLPLGPTTGWTYGNGLTRRHYYDQNYTALDRRLTGITTMNGGVTLQSILLAYDSRDLVSRLTNYINTAASKDFEFDALQRLTKEASVSNGGSTRTTYGYDASGNRIARAGASPGVLLPPIYHQIASNSNRLMAVGGANFSYDAAGNTITNPMRSGSTYDYDAFNRLNKVISGGKSTSYFINALGQRNRKTQGTAATQWGFLYGPSGQVEVEYYWGNSSWTHYVRTPDGQPVALARGGQLYMIHTDQVGRPEIVTNSAKAVVWRATNRTFSRTVTLDSVGGLNLGFLGQYFDSESSLWYNNFRSYDDATGRYVESDPIGLAGGINTYAYVNSNPTAFVDPWGLEGVGSFNNGGHQQTWEKGARVPVLSALADTLDTLRSGANEMVRRNFVHSDKFYHCLAMCEVSTRGALDASFATTAGVARELYQQHIKGESAQECAADNMANGQGVAAGLRGQACASSCSSLMPAGFTYP